LRRAKLKSQGGLILMVVWEEIRKNWETPRKRSKWRRL